MHRLFVAIRPSTAQRRALLALMGGIAHARWQTDDQLHLTLRFIGEVDRHRAEDIAAILGSVHHPAFRMRLERIGHFDRRGRIDALWAGVAPHDPLAALRLKVDRALDRVGIAPETRAFLPHITIARLGRDAGPVGGFVESAMVPAIEADIADFHLFESRLGHAGASYDSVARYPLAPAD